LCACYIYDTKNWHIKNGDWERLLHKVPFNLASRNGQRLKIKERD